MTRLVTSVRRHRDRRRHDRRARRSRSTSRARPSGCAYREFTQHFPRPGWVEHDPDEIWRRRAGDARPRSVDQLDQPVAAIGITDQRETVVAWDRSRRARRATAPSCGRTAAPPSGATRSPTGHLPRVRALTGLVLDPYFSASKMEWLLTEGGVERRRRPRRRHDRLVAGVEPDRRRASHVTDPSNASRTMLYDIVAATWSDELCDLFGVPDRRAARGAAVVRPVRRHRRRHAPLGAGIPIAGIAGDQQAALFGQACFEPGMTKNTYGTGSFVLMNVGDTCPEPTEGLLTTVAWTRARAAMLDGSGADRPRHALRARGRDLRHRRGRPVAARRARHHRRGDRDRTARRSRSPDTGGVVIVPAFTGLGSPVVGPVRPRHDRRAHPRHRHAPTWPGPSSSRWRSRPATSSTR